MIKTQFAKCGNRGPKGEKGQDGVTPHIGPNGNWWVGNTDTGFPSRGPRGFSGKAPTISFRYDEESGHLFATID